MRTLQEQYNAIKSGNGNKAQFLKQARHLFPQYINQYSDFDTAAGVLKSKQIISEAVGGVVGKGFDIWDWKKILAEETKSVEKETSKEVLDYQKNAYDNKDMKNADNVNFNEIMKGFYCELKDEKNKDKTGDEIKAMVVKNLAKDPLYYTKNGEFGEKIGYTNEAPSLGEPKEPKGKYKSSGYGDLDTDKKAEKVKSNVQDSLGDKEAKTSNPSKVKEMPVTPQNSAGVKKMPMPGSEKTMKLQENTDKYEKVLKGKDSEEAEAYLQDQGLSKGQIDAILRQYYPKEFVKETTSEQKLRSLIQQIIKEELEEALYQGPSVTPGKGSLGGRRFIPNVTVLSKDAVDAINAKGLKRLNWEKPHIKIVKSGEEIKMLVSKLLVDTVVGSQKGRSKLSLSVSKMGTGITPVEMNQLSGEFKKLIKVLNSSGKLSQNGDYFLLDVPTKYNEKRDQYEMPLPNAVTESSINPEGELEGFDPNEKISLNEFKEDILEALKSMNIPLPQSIIKQNNEAIEEYYKIMMDEDQRYDFTPEEFKIHADTLAQSLIIKTGGIESYPGLNEEMDWDRFNIQVSTDNYEGTIKRNEEGWMMYDEDNQPEEAGPFKTLDSLMSYYDLIKSDLVGDYVKNLNEYGEDSGGQDLTWGMYSRSTSRKDQGNKGFIDKGYEDYYEGILFDESPYESGKNKYYGGADLAKLWKLGWKKAEAEDKGIEFVEDEPNIEDWNDQTGDYDEVNLSEGGMDWDSLPDEISTNIARDEEFKGQTQTEQKLRSLIQQIIKEELDENYETKKDLAQLAKDAQSIEPKAQKLAQALKAKGITNTVEISKYLKEKGITDSDITTRVIDLAAKK